MKFQYRLSRNSNANLSNRATILSPMLRRAPQKLDTATIAPSRSLRNPKSSTHTFTNAIPLFFSFLQLIRGFRGLSRMIWSPIRSIPADQITHLMDRAVLFFDPSMPRKNRAFIKSAKNREIKILILTY
jgi:hypothetical protein